MKPLTKGSEKTFALDDVRLVMRAAEKRTTAKPAKAAKPAKLAKAKSANKLTRKRAKLKTCLSAWILADEISLKGRF